MKKKVLFIKQKSNLHDVIYMQYYCDVQTKEVLLVLISGSQGILISVIKDFSFSFC